MIFIIFGIMIKGGLTLEAYLYKEIAIFMVDNKWKGKTKLQISWDKL